MRPISKIRSAVSSHKLASILAVGTAVRLILIPISAHPFDLYCWYDISSNILKNGPFTLQSFPPLWYHYLMVPIAYSYSWLSGIFSSEAIPMSSLPTALNFYPNFNVQFVPGILFNTVVKIPFLISDIALTFLLYKIVEEYTNNKGLAEKAAMLWFLNPFVIWISAGWGMWDTLPALFSLAALYFVLKRKIPYSAISLSLAVALKMYPALFLVPIGIYIFKTSAKASKLKNCTAFFSVFAATSLLVFLPYLNKIPSFFISYFVQNPASTSVISNPVDNPLGFGLTYWSLYLLNRLINLPINSTFVTVTSAASVGLLVIATGFVYWKTVKATFQKPIHDLTLFMLLPVFALFLTYRVICEQFFVWAIPFLIILCVSSQFKEKYYWTISAVALAYAMLNCPFPFFFLSLAPNYTNVLLIIVHAIWTIEPLRIIALALLGTTFSALLVIITFQIKRKNTLL